MRTPRMFSFMAALMLCASLAGAGEVQLVGPTAGEWVIHHAPDAPLTVRQAARELQRYVALATKAQWRIATEAPAGNVVSLGATAASAAAGVGLDGVKPEGYRIVCRPGAVFILGEDTADGQTTPQGGFSAGTRNGVYAFLEESLGVRWLLPGEVGEEVPQLASWTIPAADGVSNPGFANRRLPYIQNAEPTVRVWQDRMRLGYSIRLNHGHNWRATVPAEMFDQHPDWFAMRDGKRVPPVGRYKLETTNPALIDHYARAAAEAIERNPNLYTYSVSPSDSGGWSTSPESLAMYEKDSDGRESITPLVLDFYRRVAQRLESLQPKGAVAGYIYANYLEPPNAGVPALPDNLYLIVAPSFNYGFTLFRDDTRARFERVLGAWAAASSHVGYYDLPISILQDLGAPSPPGIAILGYMFPKLRDTHMISVYIYGQDAWGHGGLSNYLLAKLMWDPSADPSELADEYCLRAFGPSAGPVMRRLYDLLDDATARFYRENSNASYSLTPQMLKSIYGDQFSRIESLFLEARAAASEPCHQERLAMYEKNLILLEWNLRHRRMLDSAWTSALGKSDAEVHAMLADTANTMALSPKALVVPKIEQVEKVSVTPLSGMAGPAPDNYLLRGAATVLIYPQGDDEIVIQPRRIAERGEMVRYRVIDSVGKAIVSGVLSQHEPIRFFGNEKQPYFMKIQARSASYQLELRGTPWAIRIGDEGDHKALHLLQHTTPVYFQVPTGLRQFTMTLSSASPGETASAEVVSASGKVAARFDTSEVPADRQSVSVDQPGTWMVRFVPPRAGSVDDVYLSFDEPISPWASLDPRWLLQVSPVK